MNRGIKILALEFAMCLYFGMPALAQHGHAMGGGVGHGMAAGHVSADANKGDGHTAVDMLGRNSKLDSKLTSKLQSQNLLPQGMDLKQACQGFRNLGQCVAAIHVSHNLGIDFFCMRQGMTSVAAPNTGECNNPAGHMTMGKAINTLRPAASAHLESKKATKQADQDIKESESGS